MLSVRNQREANLRLESTVEQEKWTAEIHFARRCNLIARRTSKGIQFRMTVEKYWPRNGMHKGIKLAANAPLEMMAAND